MIKPPALQPGDRIGIVSTARKIMPEEIIKAIAIIREWGYEAVLGRTIGKDNNQYAGTDADRAGDFQRMLNDDNIKAILCARGGYGTVRIIDQLDFTPLTRQPKWIIGYSDVTVLLSHLHRHLDLVTLHASMPINFGKNTPQTLDSIKKALKGEMLSYEFDTHPFNRSGTAKAKVVGGNLSILYSITGTASDIDTAGKILFLEELDEYLYHIDRMMMNLKRSGRLENLAGLVIGGMTDMNDNETPYGKTAEEIILEHIGEYNYPVAFGFPAGHLDDNRALLMGAEATLTVEKGHCRLVYH